MRALLKTRVETCSATPSIFCFEEGAMPKWLDQRLLTSVPSVRKYDNAIISGKGNSKTEITPLVRSTESAAAETLRSLDHSFHPP